MSQNSSQACSHCPESILKMVKEMYHKLSSGKSIQQISIAIRQFVMINFQPHERQKKASQFLNFFLHCETKLKYKSDQEWDVIVHQKFKWLKMLMKLDQYPQLYWFRMAFRNMKGNFQRKEQCLEIVEENDIQISKDVKLKTQYFLKWCEYISTLKQYKKLKQKQVENEKISNQFNHYGLLFHTFFSWKKMYKNKKNQKIKANSVIAITQFTKKKQFFAQVKSLIGNSYIKAEILSIEKKITNKVQHCLFLLMKKNFIKKLKANKKKISQNMKKKNGFNIWSYRFLQILTKNLKPLMNKSFKAQRIKQKKKYEKLLLANYFSVLKQHYLQQCEKKKSLKIIRKKSVFILFSEFFNDKKKLKSKESSLKYFVTQKRKRFTLIVLNLLKKMKQLQEKRLKQLLEENGDPLIDKKIFLAAEKKKFEKKYFSLKKYLHSKSGLKIFTCLYKYSFQTQNEKTKLFCLRRILKRRFFFSHFYLKQLREQKVKEQEKIVLWRNQKLSKKSFEKLKRAFKVNEIQFQILTRFYNIRKKVIFENCWKKMKFVVNEKECIQHLIKKSEIVILRSAFIKIFVKTKLINSKLKNFNTKREKRIMKNLMLLLKNNIYHHQNLVQSFMANRIFIKKKNFIYKLANKYHFVKKQLIFNKFQQNHSAKLFFLMLKNCSETQIRQRFEINLWKKKYFLKIFRRSVRKYFEEQSQKEEKLNLIFKNMKEVQILKFYGKIQRRKKEKEKLYRKCSEIIFQKLSKNIRKMKNYKNMVECEKEVEQKIKLVKKGRIDQRLGLLLVERRMKKIKEKFNVNRKVQFFSTFVHNLRKGKSINSNIKQLKREKLQRRGFLFFSNMVKQKRSIEIKQQHLSYFFKKKQQQAKIQILSLLKRKIKIRNQENDIQICLKHGYFSSFAKLTLKKKYDVVKLHCSLKHYAKQILKKGLNSLKKNVCKIKQKENVLKMQKNSSLKMEKSIERHMRSQTLSEQIQRVNLRRSRQMR